MTSVPLLVGGCGVPDTEVDSVPGPGALSTRAEGPEQAKAPAGKATAGINSAGNPADSAGGHPGPPNLAEGGKQSAPSKPAQPSAVSPQQPRPD